MGERVEDVHSGLVTVSGHDAGSGLFVVGTHSRMGERVEDAGSGLLAGLLWTGTPSRGKYLIFFQQFFKFLFCGIIALKHILYDATNS